MGIPPPRSIWNCLSIPRRAGTGRAKLAEMTLDRQAKVVLDSAVLLDGSEAPQRVDPAGRIGITSDQGIYIDARAKRANRDG